MKKKVLASSAEAKDVEGVQTDILTCVGCTDCACIDAAGEEACTCESAVEAGSKKEQYVDVTC